MDIKDLKEPKGIVLKLVERTVQLYVEMGGELVSDLQYELRLKECLKCDKFKEIKPIKFSKEKINGCSVCGCPYSTKPKALSYFSVTDLKIVLAECPHPKGNKWEKVDSQFSDSSL